VGFLGLASQTMTFGDNHGQVVGGTVQGAGVLLVSLE
jgi:hypothetical protein